MTETKLLDARKYRWEPWALDSSPFGFIKKTALPVAVHDVFFDTYTFSETDHMLNGVSLQFYGTGSVSEYAAVLCEDKTILFCIVSGSAFQGTFHSAERIRMQYYKLTQL